MKKVLIVLTLVGIVLSSWWTLCYGEEDAIMNYKLNLQSEDIISVDFSIRTGQGTPQKVDENYLRKNFSYSTASINNIIYISHYLNSFNFVDDGKSISSADGSYVSINLKNKDGSVNKLSFADGQRFSNTNKQYAVDRNEYNRFLDFIYALKTEKIILDNEVTFEPSEWAQEDVEKAIENGLVPSFNQINYKGKINRLEVCQLVDNFLNKKNLINNNSADNPFSDTTDKAIINLFHLGVINGKSDSEFCPYDMITREEFAKILSNTYHYVKSDTTLDSNKISYKDQDKVSDWAVDSVNDMTSLGIFNGNEHNEFEPQKSIIKEEVIVTLLRLANVLN